MKPRGIALKYVLNAHRKMRRQLKLFGLVGVCQVLEAIYTTECGSNKAS